jgi:hypothetical protein
MHGGRPQGRAFRVATAVAILLTCCTACSRPRNTRGGDPTRLSDADGSKTTSAAGEASAQSTREGASERTRADGTDAGAAGATNGGEEGATAATAGAGPATGETLPLHASTQEELLALVPLRTFDAREEAAIKPNAFLKRVLGVTGPSRIGQGNPAIAEHKRSRESCLEGLRGVVLQTPEQKARCGGRDFMVPIYKNGDPSSATFCIDIFEYPNRPCELPFVWVPPSHAEVLCQLAGKRLCTQAEWTLACRGDPDGGKDRVYAYGDTLDLDVCHTRKPHRRIDGKACDGRSVKAAWETCATDTEPSGSYPQCRSRFGVYDQHGNVAEIMTRIDKDGTKVSQLKGSAWFYELVYRSHDEPPRLRDGRDTYPDHCAYDPRWHVEPMTRAWHVNYHLGFRCCAPVP